MLNVLAIIVTTLVVISLVVLAFKTRLLRTHLLLLSLGLFISLSIHSMVEWLEVNGLMGIERLVIIMPALVILGSLLISISCILLFFQVQRIKEVTKAVSEISKGNLSAQICPEHQTGKDEISELAKAFDRTMVSLKLAMTKK